MARACRARVIRARLGDHSCGMVAAISPAAAATEEGGSSDDSGPGGRIRCVDVAADVGLDFMGTYGTTIAGPDGGDIMQRNMGQGAAVGDYDRDGDLDVYLLAPAGHPNALFRNGSGVSSTVSQSAN